MTMVEIVVSMTVALVVFAAIVIVYPVVLRQQNYVTDKLSAVDTDRLALARMSRELRGATAITSFSSPSAQITFQAYVSVGSTVSQDTITYDCSRPGTVSGTYKCVRTDATTGASQVLFDGLQNSDVFNISDGGDLTDPALELHAVVQPPRQSSGTRAPVQLDDAVAPRNWTTGSGYLNQSPGS
jgi:hypothetical protein